MKRLHVDQLVIGKTYFQVCCGNISKVQLLEISIPKIRTLTSYGEISEFLSDVGIDYPNESYVNDLNFTFETLEEAKECINSPDYKRALDEHTQFYADMLEYDY